MPVYTFTRPTPAYLSDGTQVTANQPRFEQGKFGKAVMVEDETTNLVQNPTFASTSNWQLVTDGTGTFSVADNWGEINVPQGETGKYYYLQQEIVTTVPAGTKVTFSLVFRNNIAGTCAIRTVMYSGDPTPVVVEQSNVVLDGSGIPEKHSMSTVYNAADCNKVRIDIMTGSYYTGLSDISIEFTKAQLEAKPYATSFIDGTRAAESLTIPTEGVLNPQEGTIEFWWMPINQPASAITLQSNSPPIIQFGDYYEDNSWILWVTSWGGLALYIRGDGASGWTGSPAIIPGLAWYQLDKWYHFAVRWYDSDTFDVFVDGVKYGSYKSTMPFTGIAGNYIALGNYNVVGGRANALFDDLRISSRARSDAEILAAYASGQPLPVDEWTMLKLDFSYFEFWNAFQRIYFLLSHIEYKPDLFVEEYVIKLEVIGLAISGSTITLKATFPDSAGDLQELENVVVKIYAPGKVLLKTIPATKISTGVYTADYTIPEDKEGQFDYEFSGSLESRTIVGRSSFDSHWR